MNMQNPKHNSLIRRKRRTIPDAIYTDQTGLTSIRSKYVPHTGKKQLARRAA